MNRRTDPNGVAGVQIVLRGDSGFCRNELMSWRQSHGVEFVFGMARNRPLRKIIRAEMPATEQWRRTGQAARVLSEFEYQPKKTKQGGWDRAARGGQSRAHRRQRESALCRDIADQ